MGGAETREEVGTDRRSAGGVKQKTEKSKRKQQGGAGSDAGIGRFP